MRKRWSLLPLGLGACAVAALAIWSDLGQVLYGVAGALWVLPGQILVHLVQLGLNSVAWRALTGPALSWSRAIRFRLVREGVNTLLPIGQVAGELVGVRLLVRRGISASHASAATTLDLTTEMMTLPLLVLLGACTLAYMGGHQAVLPYVWGGIAAAMAGACALVAAQRLGALRLVETVVRRFAPAGVRVDGLHDQLAALARDRRAMATALGLHLGSWCCGTFETWLVLWALGRPVSLPEALVIESFGMAARGAGFAVPGALGVQEGGFVLGAGLFGIPAEGALALSALKRLREVLMAAVGLGIWHWAERGGAVGPGVAPR